MSRCNFLCNYTFAILLFFPIPLNVWFPESMRYKFNCKLHRAIHSATSWASLMVVSCVIVLTYNTLVQGMKIEFWKTAVHSIPGYVLYPPMMFGKCLTLEDIGPSVARFVSLLVWHRLILGNTRWYSASRNGAWTKAHDIFSCSLGCFTLRCKYFSELYLTL